MALKLVVSALLVNRSLGGNGGVLVLTVRNGQRTDVVQGTKIGQGANSGQRANNDELANIDEYLQAKQEVK